MKFGVVQFPGSCDEADALLACEKVLGVFLTAREESVAILFAGDRLGFRTWANALEPEPHEVLS